MTDFSFRSRLWTRTLLRRLLEVDRPLPALSQEELDAQARRNYRWNFTVNLLDGVTFWFGLSFASATTILPLFISKLTDSALLIALLAVLSQAGWYLPQLFAASFTERLPRKKPIVINLGFFTERIPVWLLPLAAWIGLKNPGLALGLFFLGYAWHVLGAGFIAPAWTDLLARCFPVERRGRFFGTTAFIGTGLGALGAVASGWLLEVFPFPINFVYVFLVAAFAFTLSWGFLALTREPVSQEHAAVAARSRGRSQGKIRAILRGDHNFRRFLGARALASLALMGAGFLTVAALHRWQVSDRTVGTYTAALLVGQTVGNLGAGFVADRFGHKLSMEIGMLALAGAFVLAWLAPSPLFYYPVFFLLGAGTGIRIVSGVLIPLEFAAPAHRPTYVGIANTVNGVASAVSPLLGGLLATVSYPGLFLVSGLFGAVAFGVMHWLVTDPRHMTHPFDPDPPGPGPAREEPASPAHAAMRQGD